MTLYGQPRQAVPSTRVLLYRRVCEQTGLRAQLEALQRIEREAKYSPEDILAVRVAVWAAHAETPQP